MRKTYKFLQIASELELCINIGSQENLNKIDDHAVEIEHRFTYFESGLKGVFDQDNTRIIRPQN